MRLANKIALITGAGSGMGKTASVVFAKAGAKVAVIDVNGDAAVETARQLKAGGSVTCAIKVDGVTIVSASASGSTSVASCAMGQDLNGSWQQTSLNG